MVTRLDNSTSVGSYSDIRHALIKNILTLK